MVTEITVRIGGTEILTDDRRRALEQLIDQFREERLDGEISYRPPTGRGVTWYEVTLIYIGMKALDAVTGEIASRTIDAVTSRTIGWAKSRLERGETARPQSITLYDADGKVIKKFRIKKDGAVEEDRE